MYPVGAVDDDGDGDTVDVDGSLYGIKPVVGPVDVGAAEEEERSRSFRGRTPLLGDGDVSACLLPRCLWYIMWLAMNTLLALALGSHTAQATPVPRQ